MKKVYLSFALERDMIMFDGNLYGIARDVETYVDQISRKTDEKYVLVLKSEVLNAEEIAKIIEPYKERYGFTFEIKE